MENINKPKRVRKTDKYLESIKDNKLLDIIIKNIEFYRELKSISKFSLSTNCNLGKNTLYEINKKQYMPSVQTLERISKELNIHISLLLIDHIDDNKDLIEIIKSRLVP